MYYLSSEISWSAPVIFAYADCRCDCLMQQPKPYSYFITVTCDDMYDKIISLCIKCYADRECSV